MIRTYSDLIQLCSFEERFEYLKLDSSVGETTFGSKRYLNQFFYQNSKLWEDVRKLVILRDHGCDLGIGGMEIFRKVHVHHMNPISESDIIHSSEFLLDPEYLISVSEDTHRAIHFGSINILRVNSYEERKPNDTCPWR